MVVLVLVLHESDHLLQVSKLRNAASSQSIRHLVATLAGHYVESALADTSSSAATSTHLLHLVHAVYLAYNQHCSIHCEPCVDTSALSTLD